MPVWEPYNETGTEKIKVNDVKELIFFKQSIHEMIDEIDSLS